MITANSNACPRCDTAESGCVTLALLRYVSPLRTKMLKARSANATAISSKVRVNLQLATRRIRPNENKMSDGGRARASLGVEVWKSSQKLSVQRSDVRSIAWLD